MLIFVASRRQTRRTAFDLISFASSDLSPRKWLHMDVQEVCVRIFSILIAFNFFNLAFITFIFGVINIKNDN